MKKLSKVLAAVAAIALPAVAFAQSDVAPDHTIILGTTSSTTGYTGNIELQGDGSAGNGGLGWINANNTSYYELDFFFRTAGEVFVAIQNNKAMATISAVHLGGKGAVFHSTTAGFSGRCVEDVAAAQAASAGEGTALAGLFAATANTGTFVITHDQPTDAVLTAAAAPSLYVIGGCTALEA